MGAGNRQSLETRVKGVLLKHDVDIVPKFDNSRDIPNHDEVFLSGPCYEANFGGFFEILAQLWFGGKRNAAETYGLGGDQYRKWRPDLVTPRLIADQKGVGRSVTLKLKDTQVAGYHDAQILYHNKNVAYQIFRHDLLDVIPRTKSKRGKVKTGDIFEMLASETVYCVDLPLSLVTAVWHNTCAGLSHRKRDALILNEDGYLPLDEAMEREEDFRRFRRAGVKLEYPYTGVRSSTIDKFFFEPDSAIDAMQRRADLFRVERYMSPAGLKIEGFKLKSFPVVRIRDRHPILWVNDLNELFHPERRFSDADSDVAESITSIQAKYAAFYARHNRNGFGYRTNDLAEIKRLEQEYAARISPSQPDDVPF